MMQLSDHLDCVYLYLEPIDMRKSINALSVIVEANMGHSPFDKKLFVFCNQYRDKLKMLYWQKNGFCLWYKRLEKERFYWPDKGKKIITGRELNWLIDGVDISKITLHKELTFTSVL